MKRQKLINHLRGFGCDVVSEGANHTRVLNRANGQRSIVPRHREIGPGLIREICKQLDVPIPSEK